MTDIVQSLQSGKSINKRWSQTHAVNLGPYPVPARIEVRAFSDHHKGNATSTAWMKLYYERDLVGETSGSGDPIALHIDYYVYLAAASSASLRLDTSNRISTIKDFGFDVNFSPA